MRAQGPGRELHADQALEQAHRQQAHVFGEEAEHALGEEVAHLLGRDASRAQALCRAGEGARGLFGDVAVAALGLERLGVLPQRTQALLHFGPREVFEHEDVLFTGRAGEIGLDFDAQAVAHHQQRRTFERKRVAHQLLQCSLEALARRLVLPGEVAAQPDIGKAIGAAGGAAGLRDTALEAVALGVVGLGYAEHAAQVDEVRLRAGALVQFMGRPAGAPFADECLRLHHTAVSQEWINRDPPARSR